MEALGVRQITKTFNDNQCIDIGKLLVLWKLDPEFIA